MKKGKTAVQHYRDQRNALAYYLIENVGLTHAAIGRILGVSREAASIQFPKSKRKESNG